MEVCTPTAVRRLVAKFERTGSVHDAPRLGRSKTAEDVAMEVNLAMAEDAEHNPHGECSVRAVAEATRVARATVWRLMRKVLKFHPYGIQCMHELKPGDPERWLPRFPLHIYPRWNHLEAMWNWFFHMEPW